MGSGPVEPLMQAPALQAQGLLQRWLVRAAQHGLGFAATRLWGLQRFKGLISSAVAQHPAQLHGIHHQIRGDPIELPQLLERWHCGGAVDTPQCR